MRKERDAGNNVKEERKDEGKVSGASAEKEIHDYLRKVEKNLKGFSQDAKDSIISEIDDHIREAEKKMRRDGTGTGGMEVSISKILRELGEPAEVAREFSPVIRTGSIKAKIFMGYSFFISIILIIISINNILRIQSGEIEGTSTDWFIDGFILAASLFNMLFMTLWLFYLRSSRKAGIYPGPHERMKRLSFLIILNNGISGLFFFAIILQVMAIAVVNYFSISGDMITKSEYISFFFGLIFLMLTGAFSIFIAHSGYQYLSRDTAGGISPMKNISFQLLTGILIIDVFFLLFYGHMMWHSLTLLLRRNLPASYALLAILTGLALSIALTLLLRVKYTFRVVHIDREVFAFALMALVVLSAVLTGLFTDARDGTDFRVDGREAGQSMDIFRERKHKRNLQPCRFREHLKVRICKRKSQRCQS